MKVMVLGGTSGIGAAVFDYFYKSDTNVVAFGKEDFDVRSRGELRDRLEEFIPTHIVYSAGVNALDWTKNVKLSDFQEIMGVNVYGFLNLIRQCQESGLKQLSIVAVTSDAAWRPMRTSAIYCASKAALEMAVRVASRELAPWGWRINGVAPGKVEDTPMTEYVDRRVLELRGWSKEFADIYEETSSPLGRKVTKREVAEVIVNVLTGPAAQTGEIIAVNGGR